MLSSHMSKSAFLCINAQPRRSSKPQCVSSTAVARSRTPFKKLDTSDSMKLLKRPSLLKISNSENLLGLSSKSSLDRVFAAPHETHHQLSARICKFRTPGDLKSNPWVVPSNTFDFPGIPEFRCCAPDLAFNFMQRDKTRTSELETRVKQTPSI
jgi:hypothetical protein